MTERVLFVLVPLLLGAGAAAAQTGAPTGVEADAVASAQNRDASGWHAALSLANLFDGNVDRTLSPVRSYGVVPGAEVGYERSSGPAFAWGYAIAASNYSGTEQWDRLSHDLYTSIGYRLTNRLRLETGFEANWKGSSDDRELANTFGVSQRATYRISTSTRVVLTGAYRYKQYDEPATSGPSPYVGGKIDQRLPGDRRLTFGYRYQRRVSQAVRDRYRRTAYNVVFATPLGRSGDRVSFDVEYRPQQYERLIKAGGREVLRADQRLITDVTYVWRINERMDMRWIFGVESRSSNDPTKRFLDPSFGMTTGYRLR